MRGVAEIGCLMLAVTLCACSEPATESAPLPWRSGSQVKVEIYEADGLRALAGRWDPALPLECQFHAGAFKYCPRGVEVASSDPNCERRDATTPGPWPTTPYYAQAFPLADTPRYVNVTATAVPQGVYSGEPGACSARPGTAVFIEDVPVDLIKPAMAATYDFEGISYTSLETDDGMSVITSIAGETESTDAGPGRLRARWAEHGPVRRFVGIVDADLNRPCIGAIDPSGTIRCVPDAPLPVGQASPNNTCQTSVLASTEEGLHAVVGFFPGHARVTEVWRCERKGQLYLRVPNTCIPIDHATCTSVPFDTFAAMTLATD